MRATPHDARRDGARTKVAVLGGGVAGMTAAYELTSTPELRERYEVTVYQLGWRLGGKGASGRNAHASQRIEEHGLHIWFGFYDNAFELMRRCYEELDRPAGAPLATFAEAFAPCDEIVLGEDYDGEWLLHPFVVPRMPGEPGIVGVLPTLWDLLIRGLDWAIGRLTDLEADIARLLGRHPTHPHWPHLLQKIADHIREQLVDVTNVVHADLLKWARKLAHDIPPGAAPGSETVRLLCEVIEAFKDALWTDIVSEHLGEQLVRNFFMTFDLFATMFCGLVTDDVLERGFGVLDDEELRTWLRRHDMQSYSLEHCPILRGFYSGGFAYEHGDLERPNVAAGTALHAILRIFTYKDSILRKMTAGMGDTVFGPMYEVLRRRGARVEFFRRVTNLGLAADGRSIESIGMIEQAALLDDEYAPLVDVKGLPCWPSEPDWSQLVDGHALQQSGINFEYGEDAPGAPAVTLTAGRDFDHVVLAIPVAALRDICPELIANESTPEFAAMIENTATTMTQAFQLWTDKTAKDLGWQHRDNSILTAYVEPIDTYADMTHLLGREEWPADLDVSNIAYYCGVMPDRPGDDQQSTTARAFADAVDWVEQNMESVWTSSDGDDGFDWQALVDPTGRQGPDRMRAQYWRANYQPTERYTLSLAGTMRYRLAADESGYSNLTLAGDWIRNGIDAGCVEASVMSGLQASRAISGVPEVIVGEDQDWLEGPRS